MLRKSDGLSNCSIYVIEKAFNLRNGSSGSPNAILTTRRDKFCVYLHAQTGREWKLKKRNYAAKENFGRGEMP